MTYRKPNSPTTPAANQPFTSNVNAAGAAFPVYGLGNVVDLVGAFVVAVDVMPSHTSHSVTVAVDVQVPFMVPFHGIALELDIGARETELELEFEQTPKEDWQPAMQYCGPEPLARIVSLDLRS